MKAEVQDRILRLGSLTVTRAAHGQATVKHVPSRQVSQIVVEIPAESHVAATMEFHGKDVLVTAAELKGVPYGVLEQDSTPAQSGSGVEGDMAEPGQPAAPGDKGGALAKWAGILCNDPEFWEWCRLDEPDLVAAIETAPGRESFQDEWKAAEFVRSICSVPSRRELDHRAEAGRTFREQIMAPFNNWKEEKDRVLHSKANRG